MLAARCSWSLSPGRLRFLLLYEMGPPRRPSLCPAAGEEARDDAITSTSGRSSQDIILADQEGHSRHAYPFHGAADATSAHQHESRKHHRSHSSLQTCPPHGAKAICGARPRMEDAYTAVPFLLEVPRQTQLEEIVPPRINAHVRSVSGVLPDQHSRDNHSRLTSLPAYLSGNRAREGLLEEATAPEMDALHFFGVFDGHGGSEAALHCARTLHERLSEALSGAARALTRRPVSLPTDMRLASFESHAQSSRASLVALRDVSTASSMGDQILHAAGPPDPAGDAVADDSTPDRDGAHSDSSEGSRQGGAPSEAGYSTSSDMEGVDQSGASATGAGAPFTAAAFEAAFTDAFVRVDEELAKATDAAQVGTTAVVALVGDRQLYVGNCGACLARC